MSRWMESSEVRVRSVLTSIALFGAGTLVGASATWLIMWTLGGDDTAHRSTTSGLEVLSTDAAERRSSRQRCSDQLRRILADLEVRLMDAVDELIARFSIPAASEGRDAGDQSPKSHRKLSSKPPPSSPPSPPPSPPDSSSTPQLDEVTATTRQKQVCDDNGRNVNNSSASVTRRLFSQVDRLFEGSSEDRKRALELLLAKEQQLSHDVNFVWRLAKAMHFRSKMATQQDKNEEKRLAYLSRDLAARSIELDPESAAAHKWYAITTGVVGDYESPKVRIQTGVTFKEHVEKAITLNPKDPTNYYLLGRWCYGVAPRRALPTELTDGDGQRMNRHMQTNLQLVYALSWFEKKLASTFIARLPTATVDDALRHFLMAEKMNPGMFKENLLFIGKCYIDKKEYKTAVQWLQHAAKVPVNGVDDENCQKEVHSLLAKYRRHTETTSM